MMGCFFLGYFNKGWTKVILPVFLFGGSVCFSFKDWSLLTNQFITPSENAENLLNSLHRGKTPTTAWMSRWKLGPVGYNPKAYPIYNYRWNNPLIHPLPSRDIQVVVVAGTWLSPRWQPQDQENMLRELQSLVHSCADGIWSNETTENRTDLTPKWWWKVREISGYVKDIGWWNIIILARWEGLPGDGWLSWGKIFRLNPPQLFRFFFRAFGQRPILECPSKVN